SCNFSGSLNYQIVEVPLASIVESKLNPRKFNDPEKLQELADSIKNEGLKQPITLRPLKDKFETIIGSRRVAACRLLSMETIKAVIEDMDDTTARITMLIENLQREDLSELEQGMMFEELYTTLKVPIREQARRIGKSPTHIER